MVSEYYFCETVNSSTWIDFLIQEHNKTLNKNYKPLGSYGWKDKLGFNPNGEAIFINEEGKIYRGIWFETDNRKITIFKS